MKQERRQIDLKNIRITDSLFGSYVKQVSEKIIPYQWKILNDQLEGADKTYCIENFRIAAGELEGTRKGVVFQDTDLYKWLESVAYTIAGGKGGQFEPLADEVIELVGRAQEPDGYLNTYFTVNAPERKWKNLIEGHELYTAGHMIEAAVAYYYATGKTAFLEIAKKNADLIGKVFGRGEGQRRGYPGHQEIELALVKLYRVTGEQKYLDTAKYFIDERGTQPNYLAEELRERGGFEFFPDLQDYDLAYSQADIPPVEQTKAQGHSVRDMYMCAAMADLAGECEDERLLKACKAIWENMTQRQMYITGGIGTSGFRERFTTDYDLPNATNYSETCASIGLMMFGQRLSAVTGEAGYYDSVERALYNTVLAGINIEGDRYFYVNPLEVVPEFCTQHTYMNHVKPIRQKWFSIACCPPNVARTLASLGQYVYAQEGDSILIHQFISSEVQTETKGGITTLKMDSTLMQDGKVSIHAETEKGCSLKIRIPAYAENWKVLTGGKEEKPEIQNGYITVTLPAGEHTVTLDLDVHPHWVAANDYVRADAGKAALVKGPVVYCLEEVENGKFLSQVCVKPNEEVKEEISPEGLVGNLPALTYPGTRIKNAGLGDRLYGALKIEKEAAQLTAIPYCLWNNRGEGEMLVWHRVLL
mgnify:FL=1